jgi:hypothetical protein
MLRRLALREVIIPARTAANLLVNLGSCLRGRRETEGLVISCDACGASWERDVRRRCRLCRSEDLRYTPQPLWERGRGNQRTPAGRVDARACNSCGGRNVTSTERRIASSDG